MTILQALDGYYQRLADRGEAEPPGFSREKISFAIVLAESGMPVSVTELREQSGRKLVPRLLEVPAGPKRTSGVAANLLWDKTAYALGRTAGTRRRTAEEHAAFRKANLALIGESGDAGLAALRSFLKAWAPERFDSPPFVADMLDTNVVFALDGDRQYLHQRPEAVRLLTGQGGTGGPDRLCLVTGAIAPVARLHPAIRGVEGAQSSGASLVSFNLEAFTSYGKEQGENAPTSDAAAFRYAAALNRMLDRGGRNRLARPVGDATLVFWADTSATVSEGAAAAADDWFARLVDPPTDETEAKPLREALEAFAAGRPIEDLQLGLAPGTRFHVLGLSPNAARLSVRYWLDDSFDAFARRLARHYEDLRVDPLPWRAAPPSIARLLVRTTAAQEKFENIPPLLAGEVTRAVLAGNRYPRTLLTAAIQRLRAGDDPGTGWHAAAIRAVLARDARIDGKEVPPMSLSRENPDPAYQLGRLFAALEAAQRGALGRVNATIRDRYMGAASATPAGVFPLLMRGAQNHLSKLRKDHKGGWLEREIEEISDRIGDRFPSSLRLEAQGRFFLGYYHQRHAQFAGRPPGDTDETEEENGQDAE